MSGIRVTVTDATTGKKITEHKMRTGWAVVRDGDEYTVVSETPTGQRTVTTSKAQRS